MRTLQATEAKARITAFLAKIRASKETARHYKDMEQTMPTTIRYQRMASQEQRA